MQLLSQYVRLVKKVTEIINSKLSKYLKSFQDNTGMKYKKYNLEFFGLCQKCKSK